jgi:MoaA/NifB/PqqE/SkfB family radical SAM enzyme
MQIIQEIFRPAPQAVYLEPYFGCNFRCFCCIHGSEHHIEPEQLSPSIFEKIKPVIGQVRHVLITGLGEPLLNPNILDYLGYLREQSKSYYLTTNGSLINEALIDVLTKSQSELSVSLDAGDRETYQRVRHPDYWPRIIAALKRIAQMRAERNSKFPLTYLTFRIDAMNLSSLVQVPDLCEDLAIDAVKLHWTMLPRQYRDYCLFNDKGEVAETLNAVSSELQQRGIGVQGEAIFGKHSSGCWAMSPIMFVGATGEVAACCSRWTKLGSLRENRFEDIWNSMSRRKILLAILNKTPEESCLDCPQIRGDGVRNTISE